jgi:hypothetical protein
VNFPLASFFLYGRGNSLAWAVIGACAGVYLFYRGFILLNRKRLIENTPASKIRSASMGLVEVSGLAVGPRTMPAPITALPCFYYHTTAWQLKQSGRRNEWEKIADESLHLPFFIDDNTGKVLIDPTGAEMDIHRDFHEEYGSSLLSMGTEVPPAVNVFLSRHGVSCDKKIKVEEYCIKPKNALFVLGTLANNPGPSRTSMVNPIFPATAAALNLPNKTERITAPLSFAVGTSIGGAYQQVIRLSDHSNPNPSEMTQQQTVAAALMKAGITNPAAWAVAEAGSATTPAVSSYSGDAAVSNLVAVGAGVASEEFDTHSPAVLMKGTHNPAFFISWHSQRDVVRSLGWKSALMIWGGPALTLLSIYVLMTHFRLM